LSAPFAFFFYLQKCAGFFSDFKFTSLSKNSERLVVIMSAFGEKNNSKDCKLGE